MVSTFRRRVARKSREVKRRSSNPHNRCGITGSEGTVAYEFTKVKR